MMCCTAVRARARSPVLHCAWLVVRVLCYTTVRTRARAPRSQLRVACCARGRVAGVLRCTGVKARARGPALHCAWLAVRAGRLWACCVACCVVGALRFAVFCAWICCAVSQSGETPLHPPPLLRPASPMRFVIFLLGLQRRQLAPDLSNAQFILSATKPTELVSVRTLYNIHGLWGEVLSAFVRGSAPKASPCCEFSLRNRLLGQAAEARRATTHLARGTW